MTKKQLAFLICYIVVHFGCSILVLDLTDTVPETLVGKILGNIGFAFYFMNLPFDALIGGSNYYLLSGLSAVIYGAGMLYTYKLATDK